MKIGKYTLRDYQVEVFQAVIGHIKSQWHDRKGEPPHNAIVDAFVSAGKSAIMGAVASHACQKNANVLVLSRQGELADQNSETFWDMDVKNSIFSASLGTKSTHYSCVIGTEGTVANHLEQEFSDWLPHIILIDEAHMVSWRDVLGDSTTQFAKIIRHFKRLKPMCVVIGVTGTPMRGKESIIGPFWQTKLEPAIDREFLVDNGFITPTVFGEHVDGYDLDGFEFKGDLTTDDYTKSELDAMTKRMDLSKTQEIMRNVIEIAKDRNGVLITCASKKHCKEAASVLPEGSFGIITTDLDSKSRVQLLRGVKAGEIKYLLQIGCVTTGFDAPIIDTSVVLRRIGSLTLLIQLMGRGMRLLKPHQVEAGIEKPNHLVLDYSGTFEEMGKLYDDPILDDAELERGKREHDIKHCPLCNTENGEHARRCIARDNNGNRCEHFWTSKVCDDVKTAAGVLPGCGTHNDVTAKDCRYCGKTMIDPNEALSGKHYTDADWLPVRGMIVKPGKNDCLCVFINFADEAQQQAALFFSPFSSQGAKKIFKHQFVDRFVESPTDRRRLLGAKNMQSLMDAKSLIRKPTMATHRFMEQQRQKRCAWA